MNIIECTIKMKEESRAHYLRLAEAVDNEETSRLFRLLAAAEEEQARVLSQMGMSPELTAAGLSALEASVCVFRPTITRGSMEAALTDDPDGFRHVVAEEQEAIELFDHLAEEAGDEKMKTLCRILADQERKHLDMISEIYEFVEEPRTFLEWAEFGNRHPL